MYKEQRLTASEAYKEADEIILAWPRGYFNYESFKKHITKHKTATSQLVLFVTTKDMNKIITDNKFEDSFEATSSKDIKEYDYLGTLDGVHLYTSLNDSTELRENIQPCFKNFRDALKDFSSQS